MLFLHDLDFFLLPLLPSTFWSFLIISPSNLRYSAASAISVSTVPLSVSILVKTRWKVFLFPFFFLNNGDCLLFCIDVRCSCCCSGCCFCCCCSCCFYFWCCRCSLRLFKEIFLDLVSDSGKMCIRDSFKECLRTRLDWEPRVIRWTYSYLKAENGSRICRHRSRWAPIGFFFFKLKSARTKQGLRSFIFCYYSVITLWIPCGVVFVKGLRFCSIFLLLFIYRKDKIDASWNCDGSFICLLGRYNLLSRPTRAEQANRGICLSHFFFRFCSSRSS